ncbi:putative disease resistance protein [Camellia lanceoleosa]|uniref:Disease resistance protein n=1 Tax=Camellia lanceoleosa TaxID=1840588 RepID=A0ACC0IJM4_9ERIC|nr:putative disease resistance protein [Camellia lanceoleosa]
MELYELLKQFCYDNLDDDQYKKCFLYVALYPEDTDINKNDLLGCWEANNLLFSENTMIKGNSILHCLHQLSILEEGKSMDHVKMDKFIRQVAVYITEDYREHKHLVKASKEVKEPPDVHLWGEMNRISLGDNKLEKLPDSPDCPMLSTLFLQKNLCLKRIPDLFFKNMKKLGVLDLSHTGLILLPPSISSLDSLKILYLVDCKNLRNLPSDIDGLKQLETLDIRGNAFNNIPLQIEKLSCLRRLRVSFTKSGNESVHLNYDIISKLPKLEELIIDVNSVEELPNEMVDNIIKEVATLQQFKSLKICLSKKVAVVIEVESGRSLHMCSPETAFALYLMKNSSWRDAISAFEFYIGCQNFKVSQFPKFLKYDKYIKYCNGASSGFPFPDVLAKADAFELVNHKDIKQLSDFGIESMNVVQGCLIESCDAIETIVGDSAVLPNVEHLFLKYLPKLESLCKGPRPNQINDSRSD